MKIFIEVTVHKGVFSKAVIDVMYEMIEIKEE